MKTPKVDTLKAKQKFNTPRSGLVRKSLGHPSAKSLKMLSGKGADEVMSLVKDSKDNIEFKAKTPKKARMSLPANVLNTGKSPSNLQNGKNFKKSPKPAAKKQTTPEANKPGKKNSVANLSVKKNEKLDTPSNELKPQNSVKKTPMNKKLEQVKTPISVENNTSPIKQGANKKNAKLPFNLDDSLLSKTPNGVKQNKKTSPGKSKLNSPEVELGLQLEVALSPKSKKDRKKKNSISAKLAAQGKVEVVKKNLVKSTKDTNESNSVKGGVTKSRKRSRPKKKAAKSTETDANPILRHVNALNAVNALLKVSKPKENDLLEEDQYLYLQFNLIKHSQKSMGLYKITLPHLILPDPPEVCLITCDLKGKRNEPEEAIDHYKDLLKQNNITGVSEIIPLRKLRQDYSQYEERLKLANRFDVFVCDGKVVRIARLGRKFARARKCICPINFTSKTLKEDFERGLKKVAVFSTGKGTSMSVKCGRRGMKPEEIADNIEAIGKFLATNETLIGGARNLSTVVVKTAKSKSFPLYVSTVTPNETQKPKGKDRKTEEPVEDEITTLHDATVVVYPSGNVKVKKRKSEENDDEPQAKPKKTKTTNIKKDETEESSEDDEFDDDSEADDSIDENSDLEDSVDEEESDMEFGSEEGEDDDDDEEDDDDDNDDDDSIKEEDIEAVEAAYLQELRGLDDETEGEKKIGGGKKKQVNQQQQKKVTQQQQKQVTQQQQKQSAKPVAKRAVEEKKEKQPSQQPKKQQNENIKSKQPPQAQLQKQNNQSNQNKGNQNKFQNKNKGGSPQNKFKGNQNKFQKNNKGGSPQQGQRGPGRGQQFGGKGPNNRNTNRFQKGSPSPGRKQNFKKGPAGKNKN